MNNSKTVNATKFEKDFGFIKKTVLFNLISKPHLRDDDSKLIATIWYQQLGKPMVDQMSGFDMLQAFADNILINPESIRRMRQKVQEQQPELRGKTFQSRQKNGKTFRKTIKTI